MATLSCDVRRIAVPVAAMLLLSGCSGSEESPRATQTSSPAPTTSAPSEPDPTASPTEPDTTESAEPETAPKPYPVSLPAYFEREPDGGDLRLGTVREQTASYTSYDASYRSGHLRVTGVLNVPTGRGPFPAVVLAHGYIDPAYYVSGQGMTRERGYLATQGFVAFHVDYRNHAGSDDDPLAARRLRTGYALDVVNAVQALRRTPQVPVDDDRIGLFGRSMGGGVVYKALEIAPGLVGAATAWASVSSREDENFDHFIREDGDRDPLVAFVEQEYGLPGQPGSAKFWRRISARTYFDRITEPLLLVHGSSDSTCPPAWARASYRALRDVGVDARLAWYPDEHAFGPSFFAAMARTTAFFRSELA
jgi:dipeptidyl aminopeptidase/acylaminoacyl peptidase